MRLAPYVLLLMLAACEKRAPIECSANSDCLQGGINGTCLPSPASEHMWCSFPDPSCPHGERWGVLAGDDLERECVEGDGSDNDGAPNDGATDAAQLDAGPDAQLAEWTTPQVVENVNSTSSDSDPSIAASGLELFFNSNRQGGEGLLDIYVATRASISVPFGAAAPIEIVNSSGNEVAPEISADGRELYFERAGSGILVSRRANAAAAWGEPVTTGVSGRFPSLSADGLTMYYAVSSCDPACMATSIRASNTPAAAWGPPQPLVLPGGLFYSSIDASANGLALLLSHPGLPGGTQLVVATRATVNSGWTAIYNIPSLSFVSSYDNPSWGPNDREVYLDAKNLAGGNVGLEDIVVSVLQ